MTMAPAVRRFALTAHVVSSVGWLGTAVAYLGLVVAALTSEDAQLVRAAYLALEPITWFAIVPLAFASLLTGLVQALGTAWGLFRHYWVFFKLVLTMLGTIVLLANTQTVSSLADVAAEMGSVDPGNLQGQLLHAGGGLLVLLVTTVLAVYKPRGMTGYGRRKQDEQQRSRNGAGAPSSVRSSCRRQHEPPPSARRRRAGEDDIHRHHSGCCRRRCGRVAHRR